MSRLRHKDASTADSLDLLLSLLGEELSLNNHGLCGEETLAEHLVEAMLGDIDDRHLHVVI